MTMRDRRIGKTIGVMVFVVVLGIAIPVKDSIDTYARTGSYDTIPDIPQQQSQTPTQPTQPTQQTQQNKVDDIDDYIINNIINNLTTDVQSNASNQEVIKMTEPFPLRVDIERVYYNEYYDIMVDMVVSNDSDYGKFWFDLYSNKFEFNNKTYTVTCSSDIGTDRIQPHSSMRYTFKIIIGDENGGFIWYEDDNVSQLIRSLDLCAEIHATNDPYTGQDLYGKLELGTITVNWDNSYNITSVQPATKILYADYDGVYAGDIIK